MAKQTKRQPQYLRGTSQPVPCGWVCRNGPDVAMDEFQDAPETISDSQTDGHDIEHRPAGAVDVHVREGEPVGHVQVSRTGR